METASTERRLHAAVADAVRLTKDGNYDDALTVFEETLPLLTGGDLVDKRAAAAAFSYYGVCVAMVRRKYAEAVEYCNVSLRSNSLDPDHRANLAAVYLERNDRAKAVEVLNAGLRVDSTSPALNTLLDQLGRRSPPVVRFLPRDNPLNVWLGKRLRRRERS